MARSILSVRINPALRSWAHALLHGLPYVINKLKAYIWVAANLGRIMDKTMSL